MAYEREDDDLQRQLEAQMNQTQPAGGSTPLDLAGLGNAGGVAGGKDLGMPAPSAPPPPPKLAPMAGGAMARYGTADIEGAGDLKAGNYGGEGFSYNERASRGERGANTIKNSFGKIASRYDPTQAGASKAVMADPDFQKLFPEAKLVEHPNGDMIDFGDGNPVDVLRAARAGGAGEAWQWGVDDGSGGGGAGGAGGLDMNSLMAGITGGGDPMAAITGNIDQLVNGQDPEMQTLIQKILAGEMQP